MPWPLTSTQLCTPEQLGDSLAGYLLSGEVADAGEARVLLCCAFHLPVASLLCQLAGGETMHAAIAQASKLRSKSGGRGLSHHAPPGASALSRP
jgi:hypothetical protein